jgi:hypothetical protein
MSRIQQAIARINSISQQGTGTQPARLGGRELMKQQVREQLNKRLDLGRLRGATNDAVRRDIRRAIEHFCDGVNPLLSRPDREQLVDEIFDETIGYGPLEALLRDFNLREILILDWQTLLTRRSGGNLEKSGVSFRDEAHWREILDRVAVQLTGLTLAESGMAVDCQLPGGERFTAVIPPADLNLSATAAIQRSENRPASERSTPLPGTVSPVRGSAPPRPVGQAATPGRSGLTQRVQLRMAAMLQECQITNLNDLSPEELTEVVAHATDQVLQAERLTLPEGEQAQLIQTVLSALPRR